MVIQISVNLELDEGSTRIAPKVLRTGKGINLQVLHQLVCAALVLLMNLQILFVNCV